jgi:ribulose-phosphate 3-epimerase
MALIVPTITTADVNEYKALVYKYHTFTNRIHIDVSSGELSPNQTLPETSIAWPKDWTVSVHMMVAQPSAHLAALLKLQPALVIFQAEVQEDLTPTLANLKQAGIKAGIVLQKTTYPGAVRPYIEAADHVLIFSGDLGKQGGTADLLQLEKAHIIQGIKKGIEIGWDGGANLTNVRAIAEAGISIINVGHAISGANDSAAAFTALQAEADKQGVF